MFILQENPIHQKDIIVPVSSSSGALISFEGFVRADDIKDSKVASILYIADDSCKIEGDKIIQEALQKFPIQQADCVQRVGRINVGESAIWVGVWSSHRNEAYQASRYIIEEVKKRLHIWKKELLMNGTSVWAYGPQTPEIEA